MRTLFRLHTYWTRFMRVLKISGLSVVIVLGVVFLALQLPSVQNYIGQQVVNRLEKTLETEITVDDVRFGFFEASLDNATFYDQQMDTLLHAGRLYLQYNVLQLLNNTITVNQVHLEHGRINLERPIGETDFNYQFIIDAFASDDTSSSEGSSFNIDPGIIELKDVRFAYNDWAGGTVYQQYLGRLHVHFNSLDLENRQLSLKEVLLDQPQTYMRMMPNTLPAEESPAAAQPASHDSMRWNPDDWAISLGHLRITRGIFDQRNILSDTSQQPGKVNWNNLRVTKLDLDLFDLALEADSIFGNLKHVSLAEQSGFQLDSLHTQLKVAPDQLFLADLLIETPQSHITDSIVFNYQSLADFNDFVNKVRFGGHFTESKIQIGDLAYFIPDLPLANEAYYLNGTLSGKVSSLRGKDLQLKYGNNTDLLGNFSIYGLPDPDETFIDFTLDYLTTNKREFEELLPFVKLPANVAKMGNIRFSGNFTGFLQDFVAYGDLQTAIGYFESDINLAFDPSTKIPNYTGNLKARNFNVGRWLNDPLLGKVAFDAQLTGQGFQKENLDADVTTNIQLLELNGYAYQNVTFTGNLKQQVFDGELNVKDKNLALSFTGQMDLNREQPSFDVEADIAFAQLQPLNITEENVKLQTKVNAQFTGLNLDDLIGTVEMKQTNIYANNRFFPIGNVELLSENYELGKRITLSSTLADGMIDGKFQVSELGPTFLNFLSQYYPSVLNYTNATASEQDFFFYLDVKKGSQLTDLLLPDIRGLAGTSISGNFNSTNHHIIATIDMPNISYGDYRADQFHIDIESDQDTFHFDAIADKLYLDGGLSATHHLQGKIFDDNVYFNLEVYEDSLLNELFANAVLTNKGDSLALSLLSSRLLIAGEEWFINEKNEIRYYDNNLFANNIELESGRQRIALTSQLNDQGNTDLDATFNMVELGGLMRIVQYDDYTLGGQISGTANMTDVLNANKDVSSNFTIKDLTLDGDTMGNLTTDARYHLGENRFTIATDLAAVTGGDFSLRGDYNFEDEAGMQFKLMARKAPFELVEPFLVGVASEMEGLIDGEVDLYGSIDDPHFKGDLLVNGAALKVDYLGTRYYLDPLPIDFTDKSIYVENTKLYDNRDKSKATTADLGGEINFSDFTDFTFQDFYVYTDPNFRFMETTAEENELFYGQAYGKAIVLINGPVENMDIYVNAKSDPKTSVAIPIVYDTDVSQYDFIEFIDRTSDSVIKNLEAQTYTGLNLTMDLDVTTDAEMKIIFNQQTGEIIQGRGEGNLKLKIDAAGNFEMYGDVTIKEGDYLFRLQDVISKRFMIEEGSTISWSGDPYDANLDITAIYRRKVARYDLVSDLENELSPAEIQNLKRPVNVDLDLTMRGSLNSPDISFDITVPNQDANMTSVFMSRLQEVKQNETDLNKQVFGLIMFNQFLPPELSGSGNTDLIASSTSTVTEFLTNQLNIYFNDWLSKYDISVNFDYRQYDLAEEESESLRRNELELELNKKIGRLTINVGGNFDFGSNENVAGPTTNNLYGDFSVEYALTEDGRVRVRGFRETDYDIFAEDYRGKAGVGISFRKEFTRFSELFETTAANTDTPKEKEVSKTEDTEEDSSPAPPEPDLNPEPGPETPDGPHFFD